jgi:hypothetical protein
LRRLYVALTLTLMVFQTVAVLSTLAQPAYAYVDPGSGLLALQIISSTFAGMIFLLRRRLRGILMHMTGHFRSQGEKVDKQ